MELGLFTFLESTSWGRQYWQKVEERMGGTLISSPHSLFYNQLQLPLQIKPDFWIFAPFFSGDYLCSGAWVEAWSEPRDRGARGKRRGGGGDAEETEVQEGTFLVSTDDAMMILWRGAGKHQKSELTTKFTRIHPLRTTTIQAKKSQLIHVV